MKKLRYQILLVIGIVTMTQFLFSISWAESPVISVDLIFSQSSYDYEEPIGVDVLVRNAAGHDLLISRGFSSKIYYLELRVIDPTGRLLLAQRDEPHYEFPDAPPLAYVLYEGRPIRVAGCEVLPAGWEKHSPTNDLREHYEIQLPGQYSAQVQLSAMSFKGAPCEVDDYEWQGVLKSEIIYFNIEGSPQGVRLIPNQWSLAWREPGNKFPAVQVQILPEEGQQSSDYEPGSIRLNTVPAHMVKVLRPMLTAFFQPQQAIASLGDVQVGQWYSVTVTGRLKTGQPFGAEQKVRIVR